MGLSVKGANCRGCRVTIFASTCKGFHFTGLCLTRSATTFRRSRTSFFTCDRNTFRAVMCSGVGITIHHFMNLARGRPAITLARLSVCCNFGCHFYGVYDNGRGNRIRQDMRFMQQGTFSNPRYSGFDALTRTGGCLFQRYVGLGARPVCSDSVPLRAFRARGRFLLPTVPGFRDYVGGATGISGCSAVLITHGRCSIPSVLMKGIISIQLCASGIIVCRSKAVITRRSERFKMRR